MRVDEKLKALDFKGRDFPILRGDVKLSLKNVHNGKTEVYEKHNASTNALANIFSGNYGGLMNYNSFADLYKTYLGGVLLFASALDPSDPTSYGIPARTSNAVTAHAGQTPIGVAPYDQADDLTRGNPDSAGTVLQSGSTKMVWEWGTNAGNGTIASLGLTHTDTGSYGSGVASEAQKLLDPFAEVSFLSDRSYSYDDSANCVMAVDGNTAYSFFIVDDTTIKVYKAPINNTKYKLQGNSLTPITGYSSSITVTLGADFNFNGAGCYYHFDFSGSPKTLTIFNPKTEGGASLYKDVIDLSSWSNQTATHTELTVTGAQLWKFRVDAPLSGYYSLGVPVKAMVYNNKLFLYAYKGTGSFSKPNTIFWIDLSTPANIGEVDCSEFSDFCSSQNSRSRVNERFSMLGGIIVHDSFLINGDKTFPTNPKINQYTLADLLGDVNSVSSPVFGINKAMNSIAVNKLYLATKWNLDSAVTKSAAQSMTVEYTLTEV